MLLKFTSAVVRLCCGESEFIGICKRNNIMIIELVQ